MKNIKKHSAVSSPKWNSIFDFLFPVFSDIRAIDRENSNSAWELMENDKEYHKIMAAINNKQKNTAKNENHDFILIK